MQSTYDIVGPFRKSRKSDNSGNCVEVAPLRGGGRAVRDSKDRDGGTLLFNGSEWEAFVAGVKLGEFD